MYWKKKIVNLEYFTSENIFQKWREDKDFSITKKSFKNLSSAYMHYNKC